MNIELANDITILRDVLDELDWDPAVDSAEVGVEVDAGIVTLIGVVATLTKKTAAERAAQRVYGVRAVANDLLVRPVWSADRDDTQIAAAVAARLEWSTTVPAERVEISVEHGVVRLTGEVEWNFQRATAEQLARDVHGVKGVINAIAVKPARVEDKESDIAEKIEQAFIRHAQIDAQGISVSVREGVVTLGGEVSTWFERDAAESAAWGPGVTQVVNEIRLVPLSLGSTGSRT